MKWDGPLAPRMYWEMYAMSYSVSEVCRWLAVLVLVTLRNKWQTGSCQLPPILLPKLLINVVFQAVYSNKKCCFSMWPLSRELYMVQYRKDYFSNSLCISFSYPQPQRMLKHNVEQNDLVVQRAFSGFGFPYWWGAQNETHCKQSSEMALMK